MSKTWYHGTPLQLTTLRPGSTITLERRLAEVFSHKPSIVSVDGGGTIRHNGTQPGWLYRIAKEVGPDDIYTHPNSSIAPGKEWLTRRALELELIGPVKIAEDELLSGRELEKLQQHLTSSEEE